MDYHVNLAEFILTARKGSTYGSYYPAVVHKRCNTTVATGTVSMKRVFDSMKSHECEGTNATSSTEE